MVELSGSLLDGSKCHQIVFQFCDNLYFPLKIIVCPVSDLISNPRDQMLAAELSMKMDGKFE
jgi:hypothetical protein